MKSSTIIYFYKKNRTIKGPKPSEKSCRLFENDKNTRVVSNSPQWFSDKSIYIYNKQKNMKNITQWFWLMRKIEGIINIKTDNKINALYDWCQ